MTTTAPAETAWPEGVIARYLTVGGATVDLTEESAYYIPTPPTQTRAQCSGCGDRETKEWGFNILAHENGRPQPDEFDEGGRYTTPRLRRWAQRHAEKCRAMPKPTT